MMLSLKSGNLPKNEYAFTGFCYLNPADLTNLCGQASGPSYVEVNGYVFTAKADSEVQAQQIGFSKPQREWARISLGQDYNVKNFRLPPGSEVGCITFDCDYYLAKETQRLEIEDTKLESIFKEKFMSQFFTKGQSIVMDYEGKMLKCSVQAVLPVDVGDGKEKPSIDRGVVASFTDMNFQNGASGRVQVLSNKVTQRSIFRPDFNFEDLGIGGLSKEFGDIFRRAFAARVYPPNVIRDLGINQVRGMLLYGPPGTGKTLIARQLAKFLKAAEPKIVNGPAILSKYVGESEENIRKLFEDAEKEQKQMGENSQLHIVIFDEIDAICKSRGSRSSDSGVGDSVVNQLLSKIDGVDALNNILLIGMTNRKDLMDEALLRPGRLECHVEISLPDQNGRVEILNIHTASMKKKGYLSKDVVVDEIAALTKNFSGAELEGLVRSASSFALNRKVDVKDLSKTKEIGDITICRDDFDNALLEVKPAFGLHTDEFDQCLGHGFYRYSAGFEHLLHTCNSLVDQVRTSENTPLLTVLLHGPPGCGKTALSAHIAQSSNYPFVRRIASENYVGFSELAKVSAVSKVVDDAYKSSLSCVVLDDIERIMDYVRIGPRFSNAMLQVLFAILKKQPPKQGRRILLIATTSDLRFLEDAELSRAFNVKLQIPVLSKDEEFKEVLGKLPNFPPNTVEEICSKLRSDGRFRGLGIRTLLLVAEMAVQRSKPVDATVFMECLEHAGAIE